MEFENINLDSIAKQFEYEKISRQIDGMSDIEEAKKLAKAVFKLYLKQQETVVKLTLGDLNKDGL